MCSCRTGRSVEQSLSLSVKPLWSTLKTGFAVSQNAVVKSLLPEARASLSFPQERRALLPRVYSADEIEDLSDGGGKEVAAVLLRQSRFLEPGLSYAELLAQCVIAGPPQATQGVPEKGAAWVRKVLSA